MPDPKKIASQKTVQAALQSCESDPIGTSISSLGDDSAYPSPTMMLQALEARAAGVLVYVGAEERVGRFCSARAEFEEGYAWGAR